MAGKQRHSNLRRISRREFIRFVAAAGVLAGCQSDQQPVAAPTSAPAATPPPDRSTAPAPSPASAFTAYWPADDWRASTPEAQGIDSAILVDMFDSIQEQDLRIHSLLIIRNGYLVTEAYFHPYHGDQMHGIYSCTKGVTSALIGIALDEECIESLDQKVLDFFQSQDMEIGDPRKQTITLENLLTMSSGLEWDEWGSTSISSQFFASIDRVQFVLDRPMKDEPGKRFNYNNGNSHLLSAILQKTTGMRAFDYARARLFEPLGIAKVTWQSDLYGINDGCGGISMTPQDMAKFGYLYLQDGVWNDEQVIPIEWVEKTITPRISAQLGKQYGYHWWIDPAGAYYWLRGYNGQRIFAVPEQKMVVVFTASMPGPDMTLRPEELLETFILPAAQSSGPLPENPEGVRALAERIRAVGQP